MADFNNEGQPNNSINNVDGAENSSKGPESFPEEKIGEERSEIEVPSTPPIGAEEIPSKTFPEEVSPKAPAVSIPVSEVESKAPTAVPVSGKETSLIQYAENLERSLKSGNVSFYEGNKSLDELRHES